MKASKRTDLKGLGLPVFQMVSYRDTTLWKEDEVFEAFQPDALDDKEYNTILVDADGMIWLAHSIDLDFSEEV